MNQAREHALRHGIAIGKAVGFWQEMGEKGVTYEVIRKDARQQDGSQQLVLYNPITGEIRTAQINELFDVNLAKKISLLNPN